MGNIIIRTKITFIQSILSFSLLITMFIFLNNNICYAEGVTVDFYKSSMKSENSADVLLMKNYIRGVFDGITLSNVLLTYNKQKPIYCPPENFGLNTNNIIQIIDEEIKKRHSKDSKNISLILLLALQETFPCNK